MYRTEYKYRTHWRERVVRDTLVSVRTDSVGVPYPRGAEAFEVGGNEAALWGALRWWPWSFASLSDSESWCTS